MNDPLAQLKPIALPAESVSWWPLAPGWWALLALLALFALFGYWLRRQLLERKYRQKLKQQALSLLNSTLQASQAIPDPATALQHYFQGSNAAFKRVCLLVDATSHAATLNNQEWVQFLDQCWSDYQDSAISAQPLSHYYGESLYAEKCNDSIELDACHQWAREWIELFFRKNNKENIRKKDL